MRDGGVEGNEQDIREVAVQDYCIRNGRVAMRQLLLYHAIRNIYKPGL
jgi:hypothetical protein